MTHPIKKLSMRPNIRTFLICVGTALVLALLIWQGMATHGAPDPSEQSLSPLAIILGSATLVFREGLEAVLVLAAITAGIVRNHHTFWRSILFGVCLALIATVITWFIVVGIISGVNARELDIQAGTGLLAVIVLLVVMNWFFHKIYWTGWIGHHSKRKSEIVKQLPDSAQGISWGLASLGFTAIYREGFEIVLFLQDLRLKAGTPIVLIGAGIGLILASIVAALTFVAHQRLPYKKMLVLTGMMLGVVLVVMIGESAQEMQQAGWIPTHPMKVPIPDWLGTWFAIFPNAEGLIAQVLAMVLVIGSYLWVRRSVPKTRAATSSAHGMKNV